MSSSKRSGDVRITATFDLPRLYDGSNNSCLVLEPSGDSLGGVVIELSAAFRRINSVVGMLIRVTTECIEVQRRWQSASVVDPKGR